MLAADLSLLQPDSGVSERTINASANREGTDDHPARHLPGPCSIRGSAGTRRIDLSPASVNTVLFGVRKWSFSSELRVKIAGAGA